MMKAGDQILEIFLIIQFENLRPVWFSIRRRSAYTKQFCQFYLRVWKLVSSFERRTQIASSWKQD